MLNRRAVIKAGLFFAGSFATPSVVKAAVPYSSQSWFYFNRNIPNLAHTWVQNHGDEWIATLAFNQTGGWVGVSGTGAYEARGINNTCFLWLEAIINAGYPINCIAFNPQNANGWVIVSESFAIGTSMPTNCVQTINDYLDAGGEVHSVAVSPAGEWVVTSSRGYTHSANVPGNLTNRLAAWSDNNGAPANSGQVIDHVAFTSTGGWVVLRRDGAYWASGIPNECYDQMVSYSNSGRKVTHVAFTANDGWHLSTNRTNALPNIVGGRSDVRTQLNTIGAVGASVCVWTGSQLIRHHYGMKQRGSNSRINNSTRFQAASISKTLAAAGALRLIELGFVGGLDTDITNSLSTAPNVINRPSGQPRPTITLRKLLTHTNAIRMPSGSSPHNGGFPGYPVGVSNIPTTNGIINGNGNTSAFNIDASRQGVWEYSGAGFTLVQDIIEQLTGESYAVWMKREILDPCAMFQSTLETERFVISTDISVFDRATGHDNLSWPVPRRRHAYPEAAAAGLITTAYDLVLFAYVVAMGGQSFYGGQLWDSTLQTQLLSNQVAGRNQGLGFILGNEGSGSSHFEHNGANRGFRSFLWGNPVNARMVAVMVSDEDANIAENIGQIYISAYNL